MRYVLLIARNAFCLVLPRLGKVKWRSWAREMHHAFPHTKYYVISILLYLPTLQATWESVYYEFAKRVGNCCSVKMVAEEYKTDFCNNSPVMVLPT